MAKHAAAQRYIQTLIRAEKARLGLTFEDISVRLRACGIRQTPTNLRTKLGRGDMGAQLFLVLMKVLEVERLELANLSFSKPVAREARSATRVGGRRS